MITRKAARVERKFLFPSGAEGPILAWLGHRCLPDPLHPCDTISTIYYDTPRLALYREKLDGDLRKCKLRLRWYGELGSLPQSEVRCYLEAKQRDGATGSKSRVELSLAGSRLAEDPLGDEEIASLPSSVLPRESGARPLVPMVLIRYLRRRFVEPRSGARFSLDNRIRCDAANPAFLVAFPPVELETGVLELKGKRNEGEAALDELRGLIYPASFSKYARCLQRVREPTGRGEDS